MTDGWRTVGIEMIRKSFPGLENLTLRQRLVTVVAGAGTSNEAAINLARCRYALRLTPWGQERLDAVIKLLGGEKGP